ncbi:MAG: DNA adenine methylase [Ignavibacteriales bacterium]|nr:DNA adenine methylase [Ignavibacteriales bacterium]
MIKSPLRYPGGKSRAIDLISTLIPDYDEYREPFLGGGSLFLYLKQKFPNGKYWVNDLYLPLYKFWKMCQKDIDAVVNQIWEWRISYTGGKELHKYLVENINSFDDIKKASAFFIFNRITFSGTSESGGYSEQAFKGRFTASSIDRVKRLRNILQETEITNQDYQEVVEAKGENVFIFLDPPYYSATKSALYGKNGTLHKTFDHFRFAEVMKRCKYNWLITYDDSPFIRELFSFAYQNSWDLTYGMRNVTPSSNQFGKELFVSNYLERLPSENQLRLFAEPKSRYAKSKAKKAVKHQTGQRKKKAD